MKPIRRAVVDVGTNSVKLLVAEVAAGQVRPVWEGSKQTRLGQGFYDKHRLQPGPVKTTAQAVAEFVAKAATEQAASVRLIATSAARDAVNAAELVNAIKDACGLDLQIISGDQEADWVFLGVSTDTQLAEHPLLIVEVGGGSAEFILGHGHQADFRESFPLGTVRLLGQVGPSDPPQGRELDACRNRVLGFLRETVAPRLAPAMRRETKFQASHGRLQLVGTGGTASILGCMQAELQVFDRERLEATRLSLEHLHQQVDRLWSLPLTERKKLPGLPPNRADVILTGAVIYEGVAQTFGFRELRVSTRGLRFGAVLDAAA